MYRKFSLVVVEGVICEFFVNDVTCCMDNVTCNNYLIDYYFISYKTYVQFNQKFKFHLIKLLNSYLTNECKRSLKIKFKNNMTLVNFAIFDTFKCKN